MRRGVTLEEISDGKRYTREDMVQIGTGGCKGCHACCCGTGHAVVLDPLDVHRLMQGLERNFFELMQRYLDASLVDGIVLPNLRMEGAGQRCPFLSREGRCRIHAFRPGICRLFPLARYYEDGRFYYILQTGQCRKEETSKIKIRQWMDTPDLERYEDFVTRWHYFLKELQALAQQSPSDEKAVSMYVLSRFYGLPYEAERDFYAQFDRRLSEAKENFGLGE